MKKIFYFLLFFISASSLLAIESKIIYQIEDEIITNIDIKKEFKYLSALNKELINLDKEQIFNISKESIIREKIKKIELIKNFKNLDVKPEFLEMIIRNIYLRLKLNSQNQFIEYLKDYNLDLETIQNKVKIDALWNELIVQKYNTKIDVDIEKIKKEINANKSLKTKSYLLSEIIFEIENKTLLNQKYDEIKKSINKIGFVNTASIYSISDSAKIGGNIGWINDQSLNKEIKNIISSLDKEEISSPILIPGGVLLLKVNDIKNVEKKIDTKRELENAIKFEQNKQLNQYSKIYFNKVKKNLNFND